MNDQDIRIVYPSHNNRMGYKYRARIESQYFRSGFLWLKRKRFYRYVIERHFTGWYDHFIGPWKKTHREATKGAAIRLDLIERPGATKESYL